MAATFYENSWSSSMIVSPWWRRTILCVRT